MISCFIRLDGDLLFLLTILFLLLLFNFFFNHDIEDKRFFLGDIDFDVRIIEDGNIFFLSNINFRFIFNSIVLCCCCYWVFVVFMHMCYDKRSSFGMHLSIYIY